MQRQLDIDTLHAIAIVAHARQRNHHVFIQFEGVGMFGNRGGACTIQPEFFACFGRNSNKTFATAQIGQPDNFRCGLGDRIFIITHHVGQQYHFWSCCPFGFGRVAHGFEIAVIQVFKSGQYRMRMRIDVVLDLDN